MLYDGGIRFKGFMNDPNYFAILQVISLCFFMGEKKLNAKFKLMIAFFTFMGVIVSGSKTGFVTLLCYTIIKLSLYALRLRKKSSVIYVCMVIFMLIFLALFSAFDLLKEHIINIQAVIPVFNRLKPLITGDISTAISDGGSSRFSTWKTALEVVGLSPVIGIGMGTYTGIAYKLAGSQSIAHNTYLQLSAEWGIPLAEIFFLYVADTLRKAVHFSKIYNDSDYSVLIDMSIMLLIGSMAISLNNARIFWFCLGTLAYKSDLAKIRGRRNEKSSFCFNAVDNNI
jgi:O-antigen ligase